MKIVYVCNSTIPSRAANSVHVMKMCDAFARAGHEVFLVAPDRDDGECDADDPWGYYGVTNSFNFIKLPFRRIYGKTYLYGLTSIKVIKGLAPDLVYGRYLPGCFLSSIVGIPTVFESHSPISDAGVIHRLMFQRMIREETFRKLVVISESLQAHYFENYRLPKEKILKAPDGADPVGAAGDKRSRRGTSFQVGYVGHLYPGKGMEIVSQLALRKPDIGFHVIGGREHDLAHWTRQLEGVGNIKFHGFRPPAEIPDLLAQFDVLVAPYQQCVAVYGGGGNVGPWMSPLKIFEYMAAGRPIISSDLPVLREVLEHDETAILCPPEDIDAWVGALEAVEQNPRGAQRMAERARRVFVENYTWSSRAVKILAALESTEAADEDMAKGLTDVATSA